MHQVAFDPHTLLDCQYLDEHFLKHQSRHEHQSATNRLYTRVVV